MNRINGRETLYAPTKSESSNIATPNKQIVETAVHWNGTCLTCDQFEMHSEKTFQYKIGESPECAFLVDNTYIQSSEYSLMEITEHAVSLRFPAMSQGTVLKNGITEQIPPSADAQVFSLERDMVLTLVLGPWTFTFRRTTAEPTRISKFGFSLVPTRWTYTSVALHTAFFFLVAMMPPEVSGMNLDDQLQNNRMLPYMITAVEHPPVHQKLTTPQINAAEGNQGKAQAGPTGKAGDPQTTGKGRMAIAGPPNPRRPMIGKELLKQIQNTDGILTFITPPITSPFGEGHTIGRDPENVLGNLMGNEIGPGHGLNGMNVEGSGRGGGGDGTGALGVGNNLFNRFGHDANGNCIGTLCGGSNDVNMRLAKDFKLKPQAGSKVRVKETGSAVMGSLSREIIRRHIRRKISDIKYCYEKELINNESLSGRVSIYFMINSNGAVLNSAVKESTMANSKVENCIANVVRRISFPMPPDGGTVVVTYPFNLLQSSK